MKPKWHSNRTRANNQENKCQQATATSTKSLPQATNKHLPLTKTELTHLFKHMLDDPKFSNMDVFKELNKWMNRKRQNKLHQYKHKEHKDNSKYEVMYLMGLVRV